MGKPPLTPSRVRSREVMEQEHQDRLNAPSAQDQSTNRSYTVSTASRAADRFIPVRSTDQSTIYDVRPGQAGSTSGLLLMFDVGHMRGALT